MHPAPAWGMGFAKVPVNWLVAQASHSTTMHRFRATACSKHWGYYRNWDRPNLCPQELILRLRWCPGWDGSKCHFWEAGPSHESIWRFLVKEIYKWVVNHVDPHMHKSLGARLHLCVVVYKRIWIDTFSWLCFQVVASYEHDGHGFCPRVCPWPSDRTSTANTWWSLPTVSRVLYDRYSQNEGNRIIILLNVKQAFLLFQCISKSCKFFFLGNYYSSFYFSWLHKGFLSLSLFLVL